ncbi:MAG: hypothetical protein M1829_001426 [Trizodia sp. TS-e1964]|nr:MAG: hypothetical protein M1829_001426 [Trizodia sp. TS-e1964]
MPYGDDIWYAGIYMQWTATWAWFELEPPSSLAHHLHLQQDPGESSIGAQLTAYQMIDNAIEKHRNEPIIQKCLKTPACKKTALFRFDDGSQAGFIQYTYGDTEPASVYSIKPYENGLQLWPHRYEIGTASFDPATLATFMAHNMDEPVIVGHIANQNDWNSILAKLSVRGTYLQPKFPPIEWVDLIIITAASGFYGPAIEQLNGHPISRILGSF